MSHKNNLRKFFLRAFLCLAGLALGVSIFSQKASVQNNAPPLPTPKPTVRATNTVRANTVRTNTTVKANASRITDTAANYQPVAAPTPPADSTVRGRVFYEDTGRVVKRASIMLMNENVDDGPGSMPSALTDNEGNFVMKNVRGGTYFPMINAPGVVSPLAFFDFTLGRDRSSEKEGFANAFVGFDKIFVDGVSEINVQIPARRGGAIGGRVMYDDGDAAIGVKIEILRKVENKFISVIPNFSSMVSMMTGGGVFQTDDRGVYRFSGLPTGEYIVKVTEATSHSENNERLRYDPYELILAKSSFLTFYYPDATDTKSAQLITIQPGQEIGEINVTIPSRNLYKIDGKIVAQKDKTPVKARINIKQDVEQDTFSIFDDRNRQPQLALTDEQGNWKFKELPKGKYKLTIEPVVNESEYQSYMGNYSNVNAMTRAENNSPPKPKFAQKIYEITIEDKDLSEIIIELGYGATVSGTARVENTEEMPKSVTVLASSEKGDLSVTDNIGAYYYDESQKPKNPEHEFKLENVPVGKINFLVRVGDDDFYVKSATLNGVDLLAKPFEIKEGDNLRNVQIVLGKDIGRVKGVVVNEAKEPVKYLQFSLVPVDAAKQKIPSFYREARANEKGEFEIKAAPGEYAFIIFDKSASGKTDEEYDKWLDEAVKNAQKVTVKAGDTETVTVRTKK